jgi:hypothetical protein
MDPEQTAISVAVAIGLTCVVVGVWALWRGR